MKKYIHHILTFIAHAWHVVRSYFVTPALYTSCDELKKWNFDKISETNDYKYLVAGSEFGKTCEAPENGQEIWDGILQEYAEITKNNTILRLFELMTEASDARSRIAAVGVILNRIEVRAASMDATNLEKFIEELKHWRFYLNTDKPLRTELERLKKQLKSAKTKYNSIQEEIEKIQREKEGKSIDPILLKTKVQNVLRRHIDFKEISVKEWLHTIDEAVNQK